MVDRHLDHSFRVEVCGGIASGKTTLARLLKHASIEMVLENFQANPFWKMFYRDPVWHAFETEVTFLLQHYHQVKVSRTKSMVLVCDFSLLQDLAYADITLDKSKKKAFLSVYNEVIDDLSYPNLLIHLECSSTTELERIRKRGRIVEKPLTVEYLKALNSSIQRHVLHLSEKINIISINSEQLNYADDERAKNDVIKLVAQSLPHLQKSKIG